MESDQKPKWITDAEQELASLCAELDRIDGQGVSEFKIRQRITELQASLESAKRFIQPKVE